MVRVCYSWPIWVSGMVLICDISHAAKPTRDNVRDTARKGGIIFPDQLPSTTEEIARGLQDDFLGPHHHHHHHHDFHHETRIRPDPQPEEPIDDEDADDGEPDSGPMIPLSLAKELDDLSVDELMKRFGNGSLDRADSPEISIQNRFNWGEDAQERSYKNVPDEAACIPRPTIVPLIKHVKPNIYYVSKCTVVNRCGGCCHISQNCVPKETETITYTVLRVDVFSKKQLKPKIKQIEEHKNCECACKITPDHCKGYEVYNKSECMCQCNNLDERAKCVKQKDLKIWNQQNCACECKSRKVCSTGLHFNKDICDCELDPRRKALAYVPSDEYDEDYSDPSASDFKYRYKTN